MLGIHVSKDITVGKKNVRKTLFDAIKNDTETFNLKSIQIFTHGPRSTKANKIEYPEIKEYCNEHKIDIIVHSSYMTRPWGKEDSDIAVKLLYDELNSCKKLGAYGLVVHFPKLKNIDKLEEEIDHVVRHVKKWESMLNKTVPILLEVIPAITELSFANPKILNILCEKLKKEVSPALWGICIDTAHIYSSQINLTKKSDVKNWFAAIEHHDVINLLHFNGNSAAFHSNKDIHAIPGTKDDKIWGEKGLKKSGAFLFIKFAKKHCIPIILEINRGEGSEECITMIHSIIKHSKD